MRKPLDRLELLENIARLRRAERHYPENRDLLAVRLDLERQLGETVSLRTAARFLGVSHVALKRWVDSGDVPTVYATSGRRELPVPFVLRLHEGVEHEREHGDRGLHVLEPFFQAERETADRIDPAIFVGAGTSEPHDLAARRSLAYHRAIADVLDQSMVDEARHVVWKWAALGKLDRRHAQLWEQLLDLSPDELKAVIGRDDEDARDLRQNSPFAGMLGEPARNRIMAAIA